MSTFKKLLSTVLAAGTVMALFSTGVSAGHYAADEAGIKDININSTNFPDEKFRTFVTRNYDTNKDNILQIDEYMYIEDMDISGLGIKNLKGIEYFQGLFELNCSNNSISSIDLTLNFNMQRLDISKNKISYIEIGTMPLIKRVYYTCSHTKSGSIYKYKGFYEPKDYLDDGTMIFNFDDSTTVHCDMSIGWLSDKNGWWFKKADGSYLKNCGKQISGEWYYFNSNGYAVKNQWVYSGGKWFYFEDDMMVANGWTQIKGKWYYFSTRYWEQSQTLTFSGMQTGLQEVDSNGLKWFYFNQDGAMQTGWVKVDGKWYYFDSNGRMVTGWQQIGGKWYYMVPPATSSRISAPNNGYMATGWMMLGGKWYYFNGGGDLAIGWKKLGNKWYYLNEGSSNRGVMVTKWLQINGKWYYFFDSGEMATGWLNDGKHWFYMNHDGSLYTGWLVQGSKVYYLDKNDGGLMVTGNRSIDGKSYSFDSNGVCKNPPRL